MTKKSAAFISTLFFILLSALLTYYKIPIQTTNGPDAPSRVSSLKSNPASASTSATFTSATSTFYPVTSVVDGDTIKIKIGDSVETLRLIGLDTPETVDPRKPVQCFGKIASAKAKELLTGTSVRLETDPTQGVRDKYGRFLAYVYLPDGLFYNKYMIEQGYAHEYTYDIPYRYQLEFKAAQKEAEAAQRGLWSPDTCNGVTA